VFSRRTFIKIASALGFTGAAGAAAGRAGAAPGVARAISVSGSVLSISSRRKSFSIQTGGYDYAEERTILTSPRTKFFIRQGKQAPQRASFRDLEEDATVQVTGRLLLTNLIKANRVIIIVPDYGY
jgi:hypothetical protein